jgi:hypothetical protein
MLMATETKQVDSRAMTVHHPQEPHHETDLDAWIPTETGHPMRTRDGQLSTEQTLTRTIQHSGLTRMVTPSETILPEQMATTVQAFLARPTKTDLDAQTPMETDIPTQILDGPKTKVQTPIQTIPHDGGTRMVMVTMIELTTTVQISLEHRFMTERDALTKTATDTQTQIHHGQLLTGLTLS